MCNAKIDPNIKLNMWKNGLDTEEIKTYFSKEFVSTGTITEITQSVSKNNLFYVTLKWEIKDTISFSTLENIQSITIKPLYVFVVYKFKHTFKVSPELNGLSALFAPIN